MHLEFEILIRTIIEIGFEIFNILVFLKSKSFNRFRVEIESEPKTMQPEWNFDPDLPWFRFQPDWSAFLLVRPNNFFYFFFRLHCARRTPGKSSSLLQPLP